MLQPYVAKKVSKRTKQTRYTGVYYDAMGKPRSAGTYDDELEALTAARNEQGKPSGDSLDSMTLAQKRVVTFEEFWPIFQRHHRVEPNTMQNYFSQWQNHLRPYLKTMHVATFNSTNAIKYFTVLAEAGETVNTRKSCRSVLSAMLGLAVRMGYRFDNPVRGLSVGKQPANKTIKVINETLFWELCSHLPLETHQLFAEYIISTGTRFCEAISFQEGDLNYETGMLTVCRSTVEVSKQFHPTGGRFFTRRTPRTASIGVQDRRPLVKKIHAHVEQHGMKPGDLIFPVRLFMPDTAWVNMPRCTEEEMLEASKTTFVSPVTGNLVTHCKISTYVKHKCRCGPCVQTYRDHRSAYRVQKMAGRAKSPDTGAPRRQRLHRHQRMEPHLDPRPRGRRRRGHPLPAPPLPRLAPARPRSSAAGRAGQAGTPRPHLHNSLRLGPVGGERDRSYRDECGLGVPAGGCRSPAGDDGQDGSDDEPHGSDYGSGAGTKDGKRASLIRIWAASRH